MQELQQYYEDLQTRLDKSAKPSFGDILSGIDYANSGMSTSQALGLVAPDVNDPRARSRYARYQAARRGLDLTEGQIELAARNKKLGFFEKYGDEASLTSKMYAEGVKNTPNFASGQNKGLTKGWSSKHIQDRDTKRGFTDEDVQMANAETFMGKVGGVAGVATPIIGAALATDLAVTAATSETGPLAPVIGGIAGVTRGIRVAQQVGNMAKAGQVARKLNAAQKTMKFMGGAGLASRAARMGAIGAVETLPLDFQSSIVSDDPYAPTGDLDYGLLAQNIALNTGLSAAAPVFGAGLGKAFRYGSKQTKALKESLDNMFVKKASMTKDLEAAKADGRKSRLAQVEEQQMQQAQQVEIQQQKQQAVDFENTRYASESHPAEISNLQSKDYREGREYLNKRIIDSRSALEQSGRHAPDDLNNITTTVYERSHKYIAPSEIEKYNKYQKAKMLLDKSDEGVLDIQERARTGELDAIQTKEALDKFSQGRKAAKEMMEDYAEAAGSVEAKVNQIYKDILSTPVKIDPRIAMREALQAQAQQAAPGQQALDIGTDTSIRNPRPEQTGLDFGEQELRLAPRGVNQQALDLGAVSAPEYRADVEVPGQPTLFKQPEAPVKVDSTIPARESAPRSGMPDEFKREPAYGSEEKTKQVIERRKVQEKGKTESPVKDVPVGELAERSQGRKKEYPLVKTRQSGSFVTVDKVGNIKKYSNTPGAKDFQAAVKQEKEMMKTLKKGGKEADKILKEEAEKVNPVKKLTKRKVRCK
jgi:hypothetical protein